MPNPQNPRKRFQYRYEVLNKAVDDIEEDIDNKLINRAKNKLRTLLRGKDYAKDMREAEKSGQRVISSRHHSLLKRVKKMEEQMIKSGAKQEEADQDKMP